MRAFRTERIPKEQPDGERSEQGTRPAAASGLSSRPGPLALSRSQGRQCGTSRTLFGKTLRDVRHDDARLGQRVVIDHRASIGLQIHPLRHVQSQERIARRDFDGELEVKHSAVRLAARFADDARTGDGVVVRIDPTEDPGAMLAAAFFENEILLEKEPLPSPAAFGMRLKFLRGFSAGRLEDAAGMGAARKYSPGSNCGRLARKLAAGRTAAQPPKAVAHRASASRHRRPRSSPGASSLNLWGWLRLLQRRHVDDEAVFHVALEQAFVGFVDLLDRDHFDVAR